MMSAQFSQQMGPYAGNTGAASGNGYMLMPTQQGQLVALVTGNQSGARLIHIPHPAFYQGNPAIMHQHQLTAINNQQGLEASNACALALLQQQQQQQQTLQYYQHSHSSHSQQQPQPTIFIRPSAAGMSAGAASALSQGNAALGGMQLISVFDMSQASAGSSGSTNSATQHYGLEGGNHLQPSSFVSPVALFNSAVQGGVSSSSFGRPYVSVNAVGNGSVQSGSANTNAVSSVIPTHSLSHPHPMALFQGHPPVAYVPGLVTASNAAGPALLVPPLLSSVGVNSGTAPPGISRGLLSPSGGQSQLSQSQTNNPNASSADVAGSTSNLISQQPPIPLFRPPQTHLLLSSSTQKPCIDLLASDGSVIPSASGDHVGHFDKRPKSRAECINDLLILAVNSGSWDYRGNEAEEKQKADVSQPLASISGPYCSRLLRMDIAAHLYEMQPPILVEELKQMYMEDVVSDRSSDLFTDFFYVKEGNDYYLGYRTKLVLQFDVEGAVLPLLKLEENETVVSENGFHRSTHEEQIMHINNALEGYMQHIYETLHWSKTGVRFHIAWPPSQKSMSDASAASGSESIWTSKISIHHTRNLPIYVSGLSLSQIDEFGTAIGLSGCLEKLEIHLPSNSCVCSKPLSRMPGFKRRADFNDKFMPLPEMEVADSFSKVHIDQDCKDENLPIRSNASVSNQNEIQGASVSFPVASSTQATNSVGLAQASFTSSQSMMDGGPVSNSSTVTAATIRHGSNNRHTGNPPTSNNALLSVQSDRPPRFQRQLLNATGGQSFSLASGPTATAKREGDANIIENTENDNFNSHNDSRIHDGLPSRQTQLLRSQAVDDIQNHSQSRPKMYEETHDYRPNSSFGFRGRGRGNYHGYGGERATAYSDSREGRFSSGRGSGAYRGRVGRGSYGAGRGGGDYNGRSHAPNKFSFHGGGDNGAQQHQDVPHNSPPGTSRRSGMPVSSPDLNEGNFPSLSASNSNGHTPHHASRTAPVARKQPVSNIETGGGNSASTSVSTSHRFSQYFPNSVPGAKKVPFTEKARKEDKL